MRRLSQALRYQNALDDRSFDAVLDLCAYARATVTLTDGRILTVDNSLFYEYGELMLHVSSSEPKTPTGPLTRAQWEALPIQSIVLCSRVRNLARVEGDDMRYLRYGDHDPRVSMAIVGVIDPHVSFDGEPGVSPVLQAAPWVDWSAVVRHLEQHRLVGTDQNHLRWIHGLSPPTDIDVSALDTADARVRFRLLEMVTVQ